MISLLKKILFLAITLFLTNSKAMLEETTNIKSPRPKRKVIPSVKAWLKEFNGYVDAEYEEVDLKQENPIKIIKIPVNKFSKINRKLQMLHRKKRLLTEALAKARKAKVELNIDGILQEIKKIQISLPQIYSNISKIKDDSAECKKAIELYEDLLDYVYNFLETL